MVSDMPIKIYDAKHPIGLIENILGDIKLLQNLVIGIEDQLDKQIHKLTNPDDVYTIHEGHTDVHVINGLDDFSWDLDSVVEEYFPNIQRGSLLMSIFTILEHGLNNLCNALKKNKDLKLKIDDMHGSSINRARLYLSKVAHLNLVSTEDSWSKLKDIQKIRNIFAHRAGELKPGKDDDKIRKIIKHSPHLAIKDNTIFIKKTFLPHFLKIINEFFSALLAEIT